jgi:hypothetical protein
MPGARKSAQRSGNEPFGTAEGRRGRSREWGGWPQADGGMDITRHPRNPATTPSHTVRQHTWNHLPAVRSAVDDEATMGNEAAGLQADPRALELLRSIASQTHQRGWALVTLSFDEDKGELNALVDSGLIEPLEGDLRIDQLSGHFTSGDCMYRLLQRGQVLLERLQEPPASPQSG